VAQVQMVANEAEFLEAFEARGPISFAAMPGTIVHLFPIDRCRAGLEALAALLSPGEQARAAEIAHAGRRTAYVASRGLLRAVLTAESRGVVAPKTWTFAAGSHGKPHVASPAGIGMQFSVSYTTTLIAIAVSQKFEIGVDIEAVPATLAEVPWQVLTPAERHYLRTLPEARQFAEFLNIWTIKEAYTKYLGTGASLDFRKVEVSTTADLASARTAAETRLPEPMVKQRVLEVGTESIVLAIAAGKIETGRFAAPAGEAVTLLRRV
jgi:4'-phosphopantetheinyl transferase